MANLPAPAINFGSSDNPQSVASVVPQANIAPGGVVVYTGTVIAVPRPGDLLLDRGYGYAS